MVWARDSSSFGTIGKGILIAGTVGGAAALGYWWWKHNHPEFHLVGNLSTIYLYPVKSCRGIPIQEAECTKLGLKSETMRDREFMIVKGNGHFITARQEPTMLLIVPSIHGKELWLDAPNMPTLKVTKPVKGQETQESEQAGAPMQVKIFAEYMVGLNCGKEASTWLSDYLGKPDVQLVFFPDEVSTRQSNDYLNWKTFKKADSNTIFADLTAYMLLSEASVEDLNARLENKISIKNFRPSLAIEGCKAYDEETFKHVKIGEVFFRNVKPCLRCVLTTIDPETGIKDGIEPLRTLKGYKQLTNPVLRKLEGDSPIFGVHLSADKFGLIRVGDPIYATL